MVIHVQRNLLNYNLLTYVSHQIMHFLFALHKDTVPLLVTANQLKNALSEQPYSLDPGGMFVQTLALSPLKTLHSPAYVWWEEGRKQHGDDHFSSQYTDEGTHKVTEDRGHLDLQTLKLK